MLLITAQGLSSLSWGYKQPRMVVGKGRERIQRVEVLAQTPPPVVAKIRWHISANREVS